MIILTKRKQLNNIKMTKKFIYPNDDDKKEIINNKKNLKKSSKAKQKKN